MELQTIITAIAGFLAAGAYTMLFRKQAGTERDFNAFRVHVSESFVSKTDYREDIKDVKTDLKEILRQLSNKKDRDE